MTSAGGYVVKDESLFTDYESVNLHGRYGNQYGGFLKPRNR